MKQFWRQRGRKSTGIKGKWGFPGLDFEIIAVKGKVYCWGEI